MLVGGIGAQLHGATRPTLDLDAVTSYSPDNLQRLVDAMHELGARVRAEGFPDDQARHVAHVMVHPEMFQRAELTTWMTDAGPLDILHDIPDRDGQRTTFDQLGTRATLVERGGVQVRVAALADIINSKLWANRPKDRAALPELHRLHQQTPSRSPMMPPTHQRPQRLNRPNDFGR